MRSEPDPNESVKASNEQAKSEQRDYHAELRAKIADFRGYDELAVDQYLALSHYLALRESGMPQAQAAAFVCEQHGHDAPRGLCRRCGLGVDLSDETKKRDRQRDADRAAFLATRQQR